MTNHRTLSVVLVTLLVGLGPIVALPTKYSSVVVAMAGLGLGVAIQLYHFENSSQESDPPPAETPAD
jgi:hypothetical protein